MFAGFGSSVLHRSVLPRLILSFLTGPAESSRVRVRAFPLRLSASAPRCNLHRLPPHLTIRSSRPHVVASAMCFALRLHMSAAPPRVGLTQALGGRKAFGGFAFQHGEVAGFGRRCSSVGFPQRCFFGQFCLARSHIACVMFAGFGSGVLHRSVSRG